MLAQLQAQDLLDPRQHHRALGAANRLPELRSVAAELLLDPVQVTDLVEQPPGLAGAFRPRLVELAAGMRPAGRQLEVGPLLRVTAVGAVAIGLHRAAELIQHPFQA